MRMASLILATGLLFLNGSATAQQEPKTDLSLDDLAGPVRSVSASSSYPTNDVRLPDGPTVVLPIMRQHSEYDPDGYKTLGETQQQDGPYGESMQIGRDPEGYLYDRRTVDLQTAQMTRYERFGPHGLVDDRRYWPDGKLTDEFTQTWDENGHRSLLVAKDGNGKEVSRRRTSFTVNGIKTEDTSWGPNGAAEWSERYDPATGILQFRNYDRNGKLRLSSTSVHERVTSFQASEENLYGSSMGTNSGSHRDLAMCHGDGACDHLISDYSSPDKLNPSSVELRGPAGMLLAGAYYDYVVDAHQNWTRRTVHVKVKDKQSTLYEEDVRTILYWPKP